MTRSNHTIPLNQAPLAIIALQLDWLATHTVICSHCRGVGTFNNPGYFDGEHWHHGCTLECSHCHGTGFDVRDDLQDLAAQLRNVAMGLPF